MLVRITYEDDRIAQMRHYIKTLNARQLLFLEEVIRRERRNRHKRIFSQWKSFLHEYTAELKEINSFDD